APPPGRSDRAPGPEPPDVPARNGAAAQPGAGADRPGGDPRREPRLALVRPPRPAARPPHLRGGTADRRAPAGDPGTRLRLPHPRRSPPDGGRAARGAHSGSGKGIYVGIAT